MADDKTILFIDDNPVDRALIEKLLSKHQFNILLAANAKDGMKIAEENHPDLILLDVLLPGISGIELCKKLRSKTNTSDIPVIFYTSIDTPKHLIDYASYGAIDYVQKTIPPEILIRRIKTILGVE